MGRAQQDHLTPVNQLISDTGMSILGFGKGQGSFIHTQGLAKLTVQEWVRSSVTHSRRKGEGAHCLPPTEDGASTTYSQWDQGPGYRDF